MNFILRIYVPPTLNVAAQHIEVLIIILDLTPNLSKQPTLYDQVHYSLRIKSSINRSCEIYYSFDSRYENNKSHSSPVQYVLTFKAYQLKVSTSIIKTNHLS